MAPLKEGFGVEWTDMDDEENVELQERPTLDRVHFMHAGYRDLDREEDNVSKPEGEEDEKECFNISSSEKSEGGIIRQQASVKRAPSAITGVEYSSFHGGHVGSIGLKYSTALGEEDDVRGITSECKRFINPKVDDQVLGLQPLSDGADNTFTVADNPQPQFQMPCLGWTRTTKNSKPTPLIKRVMSEASFMQGKVMVSKSESIQEVICKRELSRWPNGMDTKEGAWREGEREVEVEVTIRQCDEEDEEGVDMLVVCISPGRSPRKIHQIRPPTHQTTMELDAAIQNPDRTKAGAAMMPSPQAKSAGKPPVPKALGHFSNACLDEKATNKAVPSAEGDTYVEEGPPKQEMGDGKSPLNTGQLEVKEVQCECCGMEEECTIGYIEHVKEIFSGYWVCGLCAEAVNEEKHHLGRGVPIKEAVRAHMNACKQFSSAKKAGAPPESPGVAHAVCHLLSRHLSTDLAARHQTTASRLRRPYLSRASSCLSSLS